MQVENTKHSVRPRALKLPMEAKIPRYWFANNQMATHLVNGLNLLFPAGERFFIRSVRAYLPQITDAKLREQVRGFFAQEGHHAYQHERFFQVLRDHGYPITDFLAWYEKVAYQWLEGITSKEMHLSTTVALEHFTAIMAENALTDRFVSAAHPTLEQLLLWHAAEEIEHKAVAFDVLQEVNPSYRLRMAGLALATIGLGSFWVAATTMFFLHDRANGWGAESEPLPTLKSKRDSILQRVFLRGIRAYIRRDFHPNQNDNYALAEQFLTQELKAAE
jgi:uncharacterized protein